MPVGNPPKRHDLHRRRHDGDERGAGQRVLAMRDRVHEGLSKRDGRVVVVVDPLEAYKLGPVVVMGLEECVGVGELLEDRALALAALGEHVPAVIGKCGDLHRRVGIDPTAGALGS